MVGLSAERGLADRGDWLSERCREKGKARAVYLIAARIPPQIPPGPRPIGMPKRTKQPPTDHVAHIGPGAGKLKAGREPGERRLLSWQDALGLASRARFLYY